VLFETLKLEPPDRNKKTASGHYSTAAAVLDELSGKHPVVDLLLEYRELAKLKSTYLDALPLQVNPRTSRVHTNFNQTGSVTGRLASNDPNLQNIPTRTETGRKVRLAFVASPGNRLLSVDYSQIELRIVAHMSGDEAMLAAFKADKIFTPPQPPPFMRSTCGGHQRPAPTCQGHKFWSDLWNERLWPQPIHRPDPGRSRKFCQRLF
jgi:DNA polymerase-1